MDYDDTALEEMLHNAHRVHVCHPSEKTCLSVSRRRPCPSERGDPLRREQRDLVMVRGQELNVGNAQIRTLLDRQKEQILAECQAEIKKHEFQANYDRRSVRNLSEIIESQQEELHCAQAEELQRRDQCDSMFHLGHLLQQEETMMKGTVMFTSLVITGESPTCTGSDDP